MNNQLSTIIILMAIKVIRSGVINPTILNNTTVFEHSADNPDGILSYISEENDILYLDPSNETGNKVDEWSQNSGTNPEEIGEYFEGDIRFDNTISMFRNGMKDVDLRWPENIIYYLISPEFTGLYYRLIEDAIRDFNTLTCLLFVPYQKFSKDVIFITANHTGCWSSVGRRGGLQTLNLQIPNCVMNKGTVIHELMHAVGFLHEQSRSDRDDYISVQWQNIAEENKKNFAKASRETTDSFGVGYDYGSIMHYTDVAFSQNTKPTIVLKKKYGKIGQREHLSPLDILKIQRMYKCSEQ